MNFWRAVAGGCFMALLGLCFLATLIWSIVYIKGGEVFAEADSQVITDINSEDDFKKFANSCNELTEYYKGVTVNLRASLDLSGEQFKDYHISQFSGTFYGNGYTISGVKLDTTVSNLTNIALIGTLTGEVSGLNLYVSFDGTNFSDTTQFKFCGVTGKASGSALINNCYVNFKITNSSNNNTLVSFYAITGLAMGYAVFNNLYIEKAENSSNALYLYGVSTSIKQTLQYNNKNQEITAICVGIEDANAHANCTPKTTAPDTSTNNSLWTTKDNKTILKIMLPKSTETDSGDTTTDGSSTDTDTDTKTDGSDTTTDKSGVAETDTDGTSDSKETDGESTSESDKDSTTDGESTSDNKKTDSGETSETTDGEKDATTTDGDSTDTSELDKEQKEEDLPKYTQITPYLNNKKIVYSGSQPVLDISFVETEENVEFAIDFGDETLWNVGEYKAEIKLSGNQNYELTTSEISFEIVPYPINIIWDTKTTLTYNGQPQVPSFRIDDEFGKDLDIVYSEYFVNAGTHIANLIAPKNYTLNNGSYEFEIKRFTLEFEWSSTQLTYNATKQMPTPTLVKNDVIDSLEFRYGGYFTDVSYEGYIAFVQFSNDEPNFVLGESATCKFYIYPTEIAITWDEKDCYEYNAEEQIRGYDLHLPSFASADNFYYETDKEPKNVGSYNIYIRSKDTKNYRLSNNSATFRITKYPLKVKWGETNLTYNGKEQAPTFTATLPNFCGSLDIERTGAGKDVGEHIAYLFCNSDFVEITNPICAYKIRPYELKLSWNNTQLTYNGLKQIPSVKCANLDFDSVSLTVSGGETNIGTHKATAVVVGENADNFTIEKDYTYYTISPYYFEPIWDTSDIVYDGQPHIAKIKNSLPSFAQNLTIIYGDTATDVGLNYTATISLKNNDLGNVEITKSWCLFNIIPAQVTVTWTEEKFYFNGEIQYPKFTFNKDFATDFSIKNAGKFAGDYVVSIVSENDNYEFVNNTCAYTIEKSPICVNWQDTTLIYNTYPQKPTAICPEIAFCDNLDIIVSGAGINAGNYIATAEIDGENARNFYITNPTLKFVINQKIIKINWQKTTAVYDGSSHTPTFTCDEDLAKKVTCESYVNSGEYEIILSCLDTNYTLQYDKKSFVISPQEIWVTWSDLSFEFDSKSHCPNATFEGVQLQVSGEQVNAGEHTAKCISLNKNYKVLNSEQNFVINKRTLAISWANTTLTYNGTSQKPTANCDSLDLADGEFAIRGEQVSAGTDYVATLVCTNENYILENDTTTFAIAPYVLEIVWGKTQLVFNGETQHPEFGFTKPDFVNDVQINVTGTGKDVGTYSVSLESKDKNFVLNHASTDFEIVPYVLEIVWSNVNAVYSGEMHLPTANYRTEIAFCELPKLIVSGGAIMVGNYTAIASIDDTNFALINAECTFAITSPITTSENDNAVIRISAPKGKTADKIEIKDVAQNQLVIPSGESFLFGFAISFVLQNDANSSSTVLFNIGTLQSETDTFATTTKYSVRLSLANASTVPQNMNLYLLNDSVCSRISYAVDGNTLIFETDTLGIVFVTASQENTTHPSVLLISCVLVAGILFAVLPATLIIQHKKTKQAKNNQKQL